MNQSGYYKILGPLKNLKLGDNCSFTREPWPFLDVKGGGIVMGNNVAVSSGVYIFTHDHQFCKSNWRQLGDVKPGNPTVISDNVFIGVNALIMHTCKYIGKCSVIGAGAVITRDVPDYEIWAGNPAICIGKVEHKEEETV
jgi:acetyltransferase-like isoleucine patch superfamily enzyme